MGTVIEFDNGQARKVLVLDARYRANRVGTFCTNNIDHPLPNYQTKNTSNNWYIHGTSSATTPSACASITDAMLNSLWKDSIDVNTSRYNTDYWLTQAGCGEATYCRSITVNGIGCDVPNIQTLMRIYCEATLLDEMDPTASSNSKLSLLGFWSTSGYGEVRSSSEYGLDLDCCVRYINYNGYCYNMNTDKSTSDIYVVPVLEL